MKKSCFLLSSFFISLLLLSACQAPEPTSDAGSKYRDHANAFMATSDVPGMAVSIYKKGEIIFSEGFGYADIEQEVPVEPASTKFRIASISKTVSMDALAQLVEEGKLDIDKEVQAYVPDFPKKRWPLTTRLVGGHIAGIRHYRGDEFLSSKFYPTVKEGLDIFKDDTLLFEPGTKYSYSSYGFNLISAVIESAAGEPFLDYMQKTVFDKLNMNNTQPEFMDKIIAHRGRYYVRTDDGVVNAPFVDNSYKWAGGGFLSTSEDLITFAKAHLKPGHLKQETLDLLTTSQKLADGSETGYGIGWVTNTDKQGHHWIGHSGGAVGGTSKMVIYPDEDIIVVILTNISSAGFGELPHEFAWLAMEE